MWSPQNSPQPNGHLRCLFALGYCMQLAAAVAVMALMEWPFGDLIEVGFVVGSFAYALAGCYHGLVRETPRQEPTQDPLLARSEAESGAAEEEKYCGLHSHMLCLSWPYFFCIVCCPVDTKSTDEETSAQCTSRSSRAWPLRLTLATCAGTTETTLRAFSGASGLSWCAARSTCAKGAPLEGRPRARPLMWSGVAATLRNHSPWDRSDRTQLGRTLLRPRLAGPTSRRINP